MFGGINTNMNSKDGFPDNELVLFFMGPLFLVLIKLSGKYNYNYRTSSHNNENDKNFGRKLVLMALGTLFYVVLIVILISYGSN